jgi:hypothetical protein
MSLNLRYFAPLLISAGAAASIALAPIAPGEQDVLPQPGSEDASATIRDIKAQGYDVQINWDNGYPDVALSQCWVNDINTADATGPLPTAYVDIECPK